MVIFDNLKFSSLLLFFFRLAGRVIYMHRHTDMITHTTAFATPVVEQWLEREMGIHEGSIQ